MVLLTEENIHILKYGNGFTSGMTMALARQWGQVWGPYWGTPGKVANRLIPTLAHPHSVKVTLGLFANGLH